jgi:hypothetical protein
MGLQLFSLHVNGVCRPSQASNDINVIIFADSRSTWSTDPVSNVGNLENRLSQPILSPYSALTRTKSVQDPFLQWKQSSFLTATLPYRSPKTIACISLRASSYLRAEHTSRNRPPRVAPTGIGPTGSSMLEQLDPESGGAPKPTYGGIDGREEFRGSGKGGPAP